MEANKGRRKKEGSHLDYKVSLHTLLLCIQTCLFLCLANYFLSFKRQFWFLCLITLIYMGALGPLFHCILLIPVSSSSPCRGVTLLFPSPPPQWCGDQTLVALISSIWHIVDTKWIFELGKMYKEVFLILQPCYFPASSVKIQKNRFLWVVELCIFF